MKDGVGWVCVALEWNLVLEGILEETRAAWLAIAATKQHAGSWRDVLYSLSLQVQGPGSPASLVFLWRLFGVHDLNLEVELSERSVW